MIAEFEDLHEAGLSSAQVADRVREGKTNLAPRSASPPVSRILRRNLLNPINLILGVAAVAVFAVGEGFDAIFAIPLILNLIIGITQELMAKRRLDRLTLLVSPRVTVVRDGTQTEVRIDEVVEGDVCLLRPGDQIVADGTLLATSRLEVDESALSGESEPVEKETGDPVCSGTFVVAGEGAYRAEKVGGESAAARLAAEAQAGRERPSPLQRDIVGLLRRLAIVAVPILAAFLAVNLMHGVPTKETVRGTVTAGVSLIPEGLLLLTSARFALGALRLAKKGLVVSRLDAVESLARVDVLCLDKTGTITENRLTVVDVVPVDGVVRDDLEAALARFGASMPGANRTVGAIAEAFPTAPEKPRSHVPFSSARRWSGLVLDGARGVQAWVIGAPESFPEDGGLAPSVEAAARDGRRVLFMGSTDPASLEDDTPAAGPPPVKPMGLVVLDDMVRPGAHETLEYFADQHVTLKLISGDNPDTVKAVAAKAGMTVERWTTGADTAGLDEQDLEVAAEDNQLFGRTNPQQKRDLVDALRRRGHHVAMTGDGVNDVLALRTADLGIALQEGTAAAQAVSSLVMLEGAFSALPETVKEGRRIVHGITVVARLFLLKTFYSALITAAVTLIALFTGADPYYPLRPRNLSMLSTFSIGIPAFWLTIAARRPDPPSGRFISEVLRLAVPGGIIAAATALTTFYLEDLFGAPLANARSATALAVCTVAMTFIPCAEIAAPRGRERRIGLAVFLAVAYSFAFPVIFAVPALRTVYDVVPLTLQQFAVCAVAGALGAGALIAFTFWLRRREDRRDGVAEPFAVAGS